MHSPSCLFRLSGQFTLVLCCCCPPSPLLLFEPLANGILSSLSQRQGLCWRPELFPILAGLLAVSPCWSKRGFGSAPFQRLLNHTHLELVVVARTHHWSLPPSSHWLTRTHQQAHFPNRTSFPFPRAPSFRLLVLKESEWQRTLVRKELFQYFHWTWDHVSVRNIWNQWDYTQIPRLHSLPRRLPAPSPCRIDGTWHLCWKSFKTPRGFLDVVALHCIENNQKHSFVGRCCVDCLTESCFLAGLQQQTERFKFTSFSLFLSFFFYVSIRLEKSPKKHFDASFMRKD